jgi:hypothetical protein
MQCTSRPCIATRTLGGIEQWRTGTLNDLHTVVTLHDGRVLNRGELFAAVDACGK